MKSSTVNLQQAMRKTNGNARRGPARGLQKFKRSFHAMLDNSERSSHPSTPFDKPSYRTRLTLFLEKWSRRCFLRSIAINSKLNLVPVCHDVHTGVFALGPRWRRLLSYAVYVAFGLTILHKFGVCIQLGQRSTLDLDIFISLDGLLLQLVPVCAALAHISCLEEVTSVMNCMPKVLSRLGSECGRREEVSPFSDLGVALRVMFIISGAVVSAPVFPVLSVYFDSVPIFIFPTLSRTGLITTTGEEQLFPKFVWQLLLYPLEVIMYGMPLLLLTFTGSAAMVQLGVFKVYVNQLR